MNSRLIGYMGFIGLYLIIEFIVCAGLIMLFPRPVCLTLGIIALLLGVVAPLAIWSFANLVVPGDRSAYGMIGTILAVFFAPPGLILSVAAIFKRE